MEARKLAGQMAALCPFALVFGMGFTARKASEPHTTLQYSEAQNQRLEAYLPLMVGGTPLFMHPNNVRIVADVWCRAKASRHLQPLTPAFQEEELLDTPRSTVVERWSTLVLGLAKTYRHELNAGEVNLAAADVTRLFKVCEILKYSDFNTLRVADTSEVRAVALIQPKMGALPSGVRKTLDEAIRTSLQDHGRMNEMHAILEANYESFAMRSSLNTEFAATPETEVDPNAPSQERIAHEFTWARRDESRLDKEETLLLNS